MSSGPTAASRTTASFAPSRRSPSRCASGPYKPNVDDGVQNGEPYETIFGKSTRWQGGAELDWQLYRIPRMLSLGPGFGFAYTHSSAKAPLASGTGDSAQDTTLGILPMHLVAVLRFDYIADHTPVPLVPYAKLGSATPSGGRASGRARRA